MIGLTRAVVLARPWHALTLLLLGMLAVAAAVAAPAYIAMAQSSVVEADVAATPLSARSVTLTHYLNLRPPPTDTGQPRPGPGPEEVDALARSGPVLLGLDGFESAYEASILVAAGPTAVAYADRDHPGFVLENTVVAARTGVCAHVVLTAGRCLTAPSEVLVDQATADRSGGVGSVLRVQGSVTTTNADDEVIHRPDGRSTVYSVVGVYRTPDRGDPYWTGTALATAPAAYGRVLVDLTTITATDVPAVNQSYVVYPGPGALAEDRLPALRSQVTAALGRAKASGYEPTTSLPGLLARVESDRQAVPLGPTVAGVPLVMLCWFVVVLAVTQTAQARRGELALLKLRGTGGGERWWLSAAESLVPLVVGGALGFVVGPLGVRLFGQLTLSHPGPAPITGTAVLAAVVALAGAVAAGSVALRQDLRAPIVELMRRVPRLGRRWPGLAAGVVAAALAVAGVVLSRGEDAGAPTGLTLLTPALIILAAGLLLAGLLDPVADRIGVLALRRGRTGLALAALPLGRRRSSRWVLALLTVAIGLFLFAVTVNDVSVRGRELAARTALGADQVVTVTPVAFPRLLAAVRSVDPAGTYAMAVVGLPAGKGSVPALAVDSSRLGAVALWPDGSSVTAAAAALRPDLAAPIEIHGRSIVVEATLTLPPGQPASSLPAALSARFVGLADGTERRSVQPTLTPGTHTYHLDVGCLDGCRLSGLALQATVVGGLGAPTVVVRDVRADDGTVLASAEQLGHWIDRSLGNLGVEAVASGLSLVPRSNADPDAAVVSPPDTVDPLPAVVVPGAAVYTAPADRLLQQRLLHPALTVARLPRLGGAGSVIDLELADRSGISSRTATEEVWLGPTAPPDTVDKLRAAGLFVVATRTVAADETAAGQRPAAVGWRFFVMVGALGLLLGLAGLALATTVERGGRARMLAALRTQGLGRGAVLVSGLLSYLVLVAYAAGAGIGAAVLAWSLDGAYLPVVDDAPVRESLPGGPQLATREWWFAAAVALVVVALVATVALSRSVAAARPGRKGGGS